LTVTVTDGSCSDFATIQVSCVAVLCGNGALDPNETCDDGNLVSGDGCPSDCSLVCGDNVVEEGETCDDGNTAGGDNCPADCTQVCGDGVLESPEVCDDGNTVGGDLCNATCTQATSLCGNGVINGTEACDDGNQVNGDGCENNCTITPIQGFCGDGISGNSPAEECDKGGGANSSGTTSCSNDCQSVASAACLDCELAGDCGEFAIDGCAAVTGTAPNGQLRTNNCYSVLECLRDSGCGETGSVTECYCGTLATGVCVAAPNSGAGAPNGPCKEVIEDALETESPQEVLTSFTSLSLAGGWALSRVTCDKTQCLAQCF
jgi:cysteine-rich repeat protein